MFSNIMFQAPMRFQLNQNFLITFIFSFHRRHIQLLFVPVGLSLLLHLQVLFGVEVSTMVNCQGRATVETATPNKTCRR